jgi:hypothetical protein
MKSTGTYLYVERLLDCAALLAPVVLQSGNQALKCFQIVLQVMTPRCRPASGTTFQRKGVSGRPF